MKPVKIYRERKLVKTLNNEGFYGFFPKRTKIQIMLRKQTVFECGNVADNVTENVAAVRCVVRTDGYCHSRGKVVL